MSCLPSGKSTGCHVVAVPDRRMDKEQFMSVSDDMWQFSAKVWGLQLDMIEKNVIFILWL